MPRAAIKDQRPREGEAVREWPTVSGLKLRLLGLVMIAGGAVFGYLSAEGLTNALERVEHIYQSVKLFVLTPLLLVFGIVLLWGGEKLEAPGAGHRSSMLLALAAALALGGVAWWMFGERLGAPGLTA